MIIPKVSLGKHIQSAYLCARQSAKFGRYRDKQDDRSKQYFKPRVWIMILHFTSLMSLAKLPLCAWDSPSSISGHGHSTHPGQLESLAAYVSHERLTAADWRRGGYPHISSQPIDQGLMMWPAAKRWAEPTRFFLWFGKYREWRPSKTKTVM